MDWMSWKTWTIIGLIIVALFAIYAFAATQSAHTPDIVPPPHPTTRATSRTTLANAPGVGIVHMEWLEAQSGSYRSERNLFSYREPPPPPPKPVPQPPPQPVVIPQPVVPQPPPGPVEPVPPQFPYKYIGTFGTQANPIATFSGNNEILNVRVGETINGKFVLRSIGIESVEISYVGFPADLKTRIPLGQ
jgi:hypothetical protein